MAQSIVLITGGNNGIGLETCKQFVKQSGNHVIMGSRSTEKGEKAIAEIKQGDIKGSISLVQLDVTSDDSIAAAVQEVTTKHGHIDTLINNAGVCPLDVSRELFRDAFEVNVISPTMVTDGFAPLLKKSSTPRIINVSTTLASINFRCDPNAQAYNQDYKIYRISKAALNMLTVCNAWEYKDSGFKVFSYCPGFVVSDLAGMRQTKLDMGVNTPENSALGMLAIHEGKQDENAGKFLNDTSVLKGTPLRPW